MSIYGDPRYYEGWAAYERGDDITACPYEKGTSSDAWECGWFDARDAATGEGP